MGDLPVSLRQHETLQWRSAGELLFREGSHPGGIWLLHSGKVDLLFSTAKGVTKPLRVAEGPQTLGVSDVLAGRPHDCSAITQTACLTGFIEKDDFLAILSEPATCLPVLELLSDELNSCYDCMRMIYGSASSRAALH